MKAYWPTIWRGTFYFVVEFLIIFQKDFAEYVAAQNPPALTWADWVMTLGAAILAGLTALRGFFDQTHSRVLEKLENGKTEHETNP